MTLDRYRWLDQWRLIGGDRLRSIYSEVLSALNAHEVANGSRQRRRRLVDQQNHETAIETLVANLAHCVVVPSEAGRLALTTGKGDGLRQTRYDNPAFGRTLPRILLAMEECGILHWTVSRQRGMASDLRPTEEFERRVRSTGVTVEDFRRCVTEEVIILSEKSQRSIGSDIVVSRQLIDYVDTPLTVELRDDLAGINAHLAGSDIAFVDDGLGKVDTLARHLQRYFVADASQGKPRFDRGGRFFGGWWQNLKSGRRVNIRLNGETPVMLDYSAMFPRLAYARTGTEPPAGDLYAIRGLEEHRTGVKRSLNCFLFDSFTNRSKWPKAMGEKLEDRWLPPSWTVANTKKALLDHHPSLRPLFGSGVGFKLMMTESVILATVLRELRGRGINALPIHDGMMVPISRGLEVRMIMASIAGDIANITMPVTIKGIGMSNTATT